MKFFTRLSSRLHGRRPYDCRPLDSPRRMKDRVLGTLAPGTAQDSNSRTLVLARLEAAFFLAEEPLTLRRLTEIVGAKHSAETRQLLIRLRELFQSSESAFQIEEIGGGFQLLTEDQYLPWLSRLRRPGHGDRLTPALLETLTILAYKQPTTRAEFEAIRGVDCSEHLRLLIEKRLVRTVGRQDSLGRPQLYGTSKEFLHAFGFDTLEELPPKDG